MYAIAHILYGLPLVRNRREESPPPGFDVFVEKAIDEEERDGFLSYYSGGANERPAAFGVELGSFDEACAYVDVSTLPLEPTDDQKAAFQALWAGLDSQEQDLLRSCGTPRVFFLWSTS